MNVDKVQETLTNLQVAERQLERAIKLFLDDKDYVSSLTLAGAAEEILGKLLRFDDKENWLDSISKAALKALGFRGSSLESHDAMKAKKEIANHVNFHRNILKHHNSNGSVTFYVDAEAADMIDRAISNYFCLTRRETGIMSRFKEIVICKSGDA